MANFHIISFSFVKRQANGSTHMLAKCGLSSLSDLIWIEETRFFLWDVILANCFSYQ